MRSKIIKKAYKRDDFKLTSHNFLLCIRPERHFRLDGLDYRPRSGSRNCDLWGIYGSSNNDDDSR